MWLKIPTFLTTGPSIKISMVSVTTSTSWGICWAFINEVKAKNTKKRKKRAIMVAMLWSEITVF
jgi:hypothetical protein